MDELDRLINYWQDKHLSDQHLMPPAVRELVLQTIKHLLELKTLKRGKP